MAISQENVVDFDLVGSPWGKGKVGTKWAKWAMTTGSNGTEDHRKATLRGYDKTDANYDLSAKTGGSDEASLITANVADHKHLFTFFSSMGDVTYGTQGDPDTGVADTTKVWKTFHKLLTDTANSEVIIDRRGDNDPDKDGSDYGLSEPMAFIKANTGDGTDNLNNAKEVSGTPFSVKNSFSTLIIIQKVV